MARQISRPGGVSLTDRSSSNGLDINEIMRRAQRASMQPTSGMGTPRQLFFADVSNINYTESLNAVIRVDQEFAKLPSALRTRFANNPQGAIDFLKNEENRSEAERMGLVRPQPPKEPSLAEQVAQGVREALKPDPDANPYRKPPSGGN